MEGQQKTKTQSTFIKVNDSNVIPFETLEAMHNHEGKNYVLLHQRDWIKYELPKYCRFAKEWNVTSLWAYQNWHPQIIKDMCGVQFGMLKMINLQCNNIFGVEVLCRVSLPVLQVLVLSENKIRCIKPIRKCWFKNIRFMYLDSNLIDDYCFLNQLCLPQQVNTISIINEKTTTNQIAVLKMQPKSIKYLIMQTKFTYYDRLQDVIKMRTQRTKTIS